jgi:hypothetical protein
MILVEGTGIRGFSPSSPMNLVVMAVVPCRALSGVRACRRIVSEEPALSAQRSSA